MSSDPACRSRRKAYRSPSPDFLECRALLSGAAAAAEDFSPPAEVGTVTPVPQQDAVPASSETVTPAVTAVAPAVTSGEDGVASVAATNAAVTETAVAPRIPRPPPRSEPRRRAAAGCGSRQFRDGHPGGHGRRTGGDVGRRRGRVGRRRDERRGHRNRRGSASGRGRPGRRRDCRQHRGASLSPRHRPLGPLPRPLHGGGGMSTPGPAATADETETAAGASQDDAAGGESPPRRTEP